MDDLRLGHGSPAARRRCAIILSAALLLPALPAAAAASTSSGSTRASIARIVDGLTYYFGKTGKYPGEGVPRQENSFPLLFDALCRPLEDGERIMAFREHEVLVMDEVDGDYRPATEGEIADPRVPKLLADAWGRPFIYRYLGREPKPPGFDATAFILYSMGPDGIDQTILGEEGDDITCRNLHGRLAPIDLIPAVIVASLVLGLGVSIAASLLSRRHDRQVPPDLHGG